MNNGNRRALLEDVARAAGVSTASVSRVLNNAPHVSDRLKATVETAIAEIGYVPDGSARALASRRSGVIGAMVPTLANPIFSLLIDSLERRLKSHDYRLLIATYRYDLDDEAESLKTFVRQGVDGVVLVGHDHTANAREWIERYQLPYLTCWHDTEASDWPRVGFDNTGAASNLVRHLLELGHREFGVITAPITFNDRARSRLQGFRRAIIEAGLTLPDERVLTFDYGIQEGMQGFRALMRQQGRPTAILCGNDVLAFGAMLEAQATGIRIPDEVSLTGFDDLPQSGFMVPGLTTIAIPVEEIGSRTADAIVARVNHSPSPHRQIVETRLIVRGSTGSPSSPKSP